MKPLSIITILTAILLTSCTGSNQPVPRRTAYPRIEAIDTSMALVDNIPAIFKVNSSTNLSQDLEKGWLDAHYNKYNVTLHTTFTPTTPENIAEIVNNRMERLILNTGDAPSKQSEFVNANGFSIYMSETEGISTPLQFIATDDSSLVVSGAYYFNDANATTNNDSISPVIKFLRDDMLRSLKSLSRK